MNRNIKRKKKKEVEWKGGYAAMLCVVTVTCSKGRLRWGNDDKNNNTRED